MNTALCILLQCSSVNSGNFHSKPGLSVAMETACFLALLTKWVSLLRFKIRQREELRKKKRETDRCPEELLKHSKYKFPNPDVHIQWTGDINYTNPQRFEAVLIYEADSNILPLRERVTVESVRSAFVFASCCYRWHSPFELNVGQLYWQLTLRGFFWATFLIEKVKNATLNQQVTSFLKILSLPRPHSPLVGKNLSC